ncbi:S-layer homology domain-containing protein [Sporosarcina ureae]|uniref:S-layer homology domain-containing protein n=1 Tax=Sporosarcina ureae TaxID=1571 RepID=UPI0028B057F4|nr:S-layer homology domain-containing protein [Sporosarcina ureae]
MKNTLRVLLWTAFALALSLVFADFNEASAKEFKDVSKKHPNYTAIQEIQKAGYINGYPDGTFRPGEPVSRQHVASLLDQVLKFPQPPTDKLVFADVPKNHMYYKPVMKLYNKGIISGGLDKKFNPNASITRIQMAKMLDLAFEFHMKEPAQFEDLSFLHWGYVHASALYSNGVTKGDHGKFLPNQSVTRAHYAEFLYRAMKVGKTPSGSVVSKEKAVDLTMRLPIVIEGIRIQGKIDNQSYSQLRSKQLPYATQAFVDGLLKEDYPSVCTHCDSFLFPGLTIEPSMRFDYTQPDANTLHVHTVSFSNLLIGGGFVDYVFKKESGSWKMDNFSGAAVGKKNFELTRQEAERVVKLNYPNSSKVRISYVSQTKETGEDPVTKEKYSFTQYKFSVDSENGRETVRVNSDDGYAY